MLKITVEEWNKIPQAYKGIYEDYQGHFPHLKGRKEWLTHDEVKGTVLLIEGIGFEIIK